MAATAISAKACRDGSDNASENQRRNPCISCVGQALHRLLKQQEYHARLEGF